MKTVARARIRRRGFGLRDQPPIPMRHRHAGFRASGYRWWDDSVIGYRAYTPEHGSNPLTGVTLAWSFTGLARPTR